MHLLAPKGDFRAPGAKPFINVRFWELFWRPGTGEVHFLPKKCGIPAEYRNSTKMLVFAMKSALFAKSYFSHKVYFLRKGSLFDFSTFREKCILKEHFS